MKLQNNKDLNLKEDSDSVKEMAAMADELHDLATAAARMYNYFVSFREDLKRRINDQVQEGHDNAE